MKIGNPPYFSATRSFPNLILERYLPPHPYGALNAMLYEIDIKDGWLIDPIGNQPLSAIELAQAGYQVFVASNNPILARLLQVICAAYPVSLYQAAIAEFGSLKRGNERLENQIKSFYPARCPSCASDQVQIKYLWRKKEKTPFNKEITCDQCGYNATTRLNEEDLKSLRNIGNPHLHSGRVIQRILPGIKEIPPAVSEVVSSYLPRSLAVISSMINKLDGLRTTEEKRNIIEALLINVFDYGNMLQNISSPKNRPKQISIPAEFYEYNLWQVFENGIEKLRLFEEPIPFTIYPDLPPQSGGICLYPGRITAIKPRDSLPPFRAVATVLPRPNQALWTYNAIWSGWLWGPDAARRLKGALERRRYDWIWHTQAIRTIFNYFENHPAPFLATAPETTNSYLMAYMGSARNASYFLEKAAFLTEEKAGQFYWVSDKKTRNIEICDRPEGNLISYLEHKSDAATYQELMALYLISETIDRNNESLLCDLDNTSFLTFQRQFDFLITNRENFIKMDEDQLEYSEFWLRNPLIKLQPLWDRIEKLFLQFILQKEAFTFQEINLEINRNLPGMLPTPASFLQRLLNSYCEKSTLNPDLYQVKYLESKEARKTDINEIRDILTTLGARFGFNVSGTNPIKWESNQLTPGYHFFITASSIISQFQSRENNDSSEIVIVMPGSRAELISFKLKNSPVYSKMAGNFHFIKFRHLRRMMENSDLNLSAWTQTMDADPVYWQESSQPVLFR